MDSIDLTADLTALPASGTSHLLCESPPSGSSSRPVLSSFDLVSTPDLPTGDRGQDQGLERARERAARTREEKLQDDLLLLKKPNGALALYTYALMAIQSTTEVSGYSRCLPTTQPGLDLDIESAA